MVVLWQSSFIRAKVVVIGKKWIYSGKSGSIRAKVMFFGQKWLSSGKVVLFGKK